MNNDTYHTYDNAGRIRPALSAKIPSISTATRHVLRMTSDV